MILSGGDRYVGLVQLVALASACVAIAGVARRLGFDLSSGCLCRSLAFSTFTVVDVPDVRRRSTTWSVAGVSRSPARTSRSAPRDVELVARGPRARARARHEAHDGARLPVLIAFVLAANRRGTWPALGVAGIAGLVGGSVWYYVNVVATGTLDGGLSDAFPQIADRSLGPTLDRIGWLVRDSPRDVRRRRWGWLRSPTPGLIAALALLVVPPRSYSRGANVPRPSPHSPRRAPSCCTRCSRLGSWSADMRRVRLLGSRRASRSVPARRCPRALRERHPLRVRRGVHPRALNLGLARSSAETSLGAGFALAAAVAVASSLLFILMLSR